MASKGRKKDCEEENDRIVDGDFRKPQVQSVKKQLVLSVPEANNPINDLVKVGNRQNENAHGKNMLWM